ncbi:hypothetical protein Z951_04075 [Streptomyces sp. PRh5]|nr:hypothetical protein Z951_04075 [Streptomyces sp. PRh5]
MQQPISQRSDLVLQSDVRLLAVLDDHACLDRGWETLAHGTASFPVVRIDQILVRGVDPRASWTLPATGSDHLPVVARLRL